MIRAWLLTASCVALLAAWATGHEPASTTGHQTLLAKTDKPAAGQAKKSKPSETAGPLAGVTTFDQLSALAKKQNTATAVVALYKLFLKDPKIAKAEKDLAREDLSHWQDLADQGAVRIGAKWLTAAQLEEMRRNEEQLVSEATKLIETDNDELAQEKLLAAARANPLAYIPHFLLGLHHAINKRNSHAAEQDFTECVKRLKRIESPTNSQRASLRAALNNLAITEARHKKHASAVKHWKEATDEHTASVELVQNVGRFVYLAKAMPLLAIPKETEKSAGNLFAILALQAKGKSFRDHIGWLYISYFDPEGKKDPAHPSDDPMPPGAQPAPEQLELVGFGTGWVVQPGFIVTNNHVAGDADGLEIVARRNQAIKYKATVRALSPTSDIALLECKDFTGPPIPISTDPPKLASDVMVLGYPTPDVMGTQLKVVKGTISGLPDPAVKNLLLYDALTNPGSSGGPVCDQRGRVVALNKGAFVVENKIAVGIPAAVLLGFLVNELPAFQHAPASAAPLEWPDIADKLGESTVLVHILMSPAKVHAITKKAPKRKDKPVDHIALEDPWCMICGGSGQVDCPNCSRGATTVMSSSVAGINTITGERTVVSTPTKVACRTCRATGHIACTHCFDGIDPTVLGAKPR